jgi:hypothetical protein
MNIYIYFFIFVIIWFNFTPYYISSMDFTQLTAQFMTNRKFVDKLDIPDREISYQSFLRDIEFYKDRSLELTEALITEREQVEPYLTKDVITSFNAYMRACICYFRTTDLNDINQKEEYGDDLSRFRIKTEKELEEEALQELDDLCGDGDDIPFQYADNIMMRQIQLKPNNLDRFLKYEKIEVPIVLPKQKEIDLGHPDLKTKPFFPPQPQPEPPPPNTPYPPVTLNIEQCSSPVDEVKEVTNALIEELISIVIDKLENTIETEIEPKQEPDPEPKPETKPKKSQKKNKKKPSKKVETIHIDV